MILNLQERLTCHRSQLQNLLVLPPLNNLLWFLPHLASQFAETLSYVSCFWKKISVCAVRLFILFNIIIPKIENKGKKKDTRCFSSSLFKKIKSHSLINFLHCISLPLQQMYLDFGPLVRQIKDTITVGSSFAAHSPGLLQRVVTYLTGKYELGAHTALQTQKLYSYSLFL